MYTAFASVYDRLMTGVDYQGWANFYHALMERYGIPRGKVCECACGTGSLTIPLAAMGYQMTGVDISPDMLFEASQKARKAGAMIPFVKQDMRQLHLHRQMDAVLCTNDGVNYLRSEDELRQFFQAAHRVLREGGGLFLDLSTPYKLRRVLGNHFIGDEDENIAYLWQNRYHEQQNCVDESGHFRPAGGRDLSAHRRTAAPVRPYGGNAGDAPARVRLYRRGRFRRQAHGSAGRKGMPLVRRRPQAAWRRGSLISGKGTEEK